MSDSLRDALEDLAAKWGGMLATHGVQPASMPWAEGVDSAYHTAADELRAALAAHPVED